MFGAVSTVHWAASLQHDSKTDQNSGSLFPTLILNCDWTTDSIVAPWFVNGFIWSWVRTLLSWVRSLCLDSCESQSHNTSWPRDSESWTFPKTDLERETGKYSLYKYAYTFNPPLAACFIPIQFHFKILKQRAILDSDQWPWPKSEFMWMLTQCNATQHGLLWWLMQCCVYVCVCCEFVEAYDGRAVCCVATQDTTESGIDYMLRAPLPTVCKVLPPRLLLGNSSFYQLHSQNLISNEPDFILDRTVLCNSVLLGRMGHTFFK